MVGRLSSRNSGWMVASLVVVHCMCCVFGKATLDRGGVGAVTGQFPSEDAEEGSRDKDPMDSVFNEEPFYELMPDHSKSTTSLTPGSTDTMAPVNASRASDLLSNGTSSPSDTNGNATVLTTQSINSTGISSSNMNITATPSLSVTPTAALNATVQSMNGSAQRATASSQLTPLNATKSTWIDYRSANASRNETSIVDSISPSRAVGYHQMNSTAAASNNDGSNRTDALPSTASSSNSSSSGSVNSTEVAHVTLGVIDASTVSWSASVTSSTSQPISSSKFSHNFPHSSLGTGSFRSSSSGLASWENDLSLSTDPVQNGDHTSIENNLPRTPQLPTTNKEEPATAFGNPELIPGQDLGRKSTRFFYASIILPIVSAVIGAFIITTAIILCRCCKRRRLKKVRYFGGKPKSDFVRLDRMNLLSDSSDEDD